MIITRRAAGRPTGMPARPYRTVRYGRALSPVLSVLASLFPFHTGCPVLVLRATAGRLRGVRHRAVLSVLSSPAVRVLAMSSTGKYRGRTRALHRCDLRIALSPSPRASNVAISAHNRPAGACRSSLLSRKVPRMSTKVSSSSLFSR